MNDKTALNRSVWKLLHKIVMDYEWGKISEVDAVEECALVLTMYALAIRGEHGDLNINLPRRLEDRLRQRRLGSDYAPE